MSIYRLQFKFVLYRDIGKCYLHGLELLPLNLSVKWKKVIKVCSLYKTDDPVCLPDRNKSKLLSKEESRLSSVRERNNQIGFKGNLSGNQFFFENSVVYLLLLN